MAEVTDESPSFLRADAVQVLEPSGRPGRTGMSPRRTGPVWGVRLAARLAAGPAGPQGDLVSEQLRRVAGIDREVAVEAVDGAPDGLGWRTRVRFAVDPAGRAGFHRHRSHDIEPVEPVPDRIGRR